MAKIGKHIPVNSKSRDRAGAQRCQLIDLRANNGPERNTHGRLSRPYYANKIEA